MAIGIANFQSIFKTLYPREDIPWLIPKNLPFLNMIKKEDGLSGDLIDWPFKYGPAQGYSVDFGTAATYAGSPNRMLRAQVRVSQSYKFCEFFDKDAKLSVGEGAYAEMIQETMTGAIADFYKQIDLDAHAAGTGYRGQVAAVAGQVNPFNSAQTLTAGQIAIQLGTALEAVFDQDQPLQAATWAGFTARPPADGRAPTTLSQSPAQVLSVDPMNRIVTLSDASAFTVGAFIVQAGGAVGFSSSNLNGAIAGLDAWNPYGGVPANDNFFGINRSIYPTRLAGYFFDATKLSIEDGIKRLSARMSQGGADNSTVALINPLDYDILDSKMSTNVHYGSVETATHGFSSIVIMGAAGRIDCVCDPHMQQGLVRLIDPTTWVLKAEGELPHVVDVEGRTMEQAVNFDGRTCRLRAYPQIFCTEPHRNGVAALPLIGNP